MTRKRIFGLDLLRAIAILCVLVWHSTTRFFSISTETGKFLGFLGYIGVEMFFVLSGFLIGGILLAQFSEKADVASLSKFWMRRWLRTLPAYYTFLIILVVIAIVDARSKWQFSWSSFLGYVFFVQNLAWKMPSFFPHSWSPAVEEWFYLTMPIVFLISLKVLSNKKTAILVSAGFFVLLSMTRIFWETSETWEWRYEIRTTVIFRLDALMTGVVAAYIARYHPVVWKEVRLRCLSLAIFAFALTGYSYFSLDLNSSFFAKVFLLPLCSISFMLLLPSLSLWTGGTKGWTPAFIHSTSVWSYSLYLCNNTVVGLVARVFEHFPPHPFLFLSR